MADGRGWTAWMGLVTTGDGREINTSGGVVHFTGIAWAGEAGKPADAVRIAPREVGSCRAHAWPCRATPGCAAAASPSSSSCTTRMSIYRCVCGSPAAGWASSRPRSWSTTMSSPRATPSGGCWSGTGGRRSALLPGAAAGAAGAGAGGVRAAVIAAAATGGWLPEKRRAAAETLRALPGLRRERREIQAARTVSAAEFAAWLTADLSSPYLGRVASSRGVNLALRAYWRVVLGLLGARAQPAPTDRRASSSDSAARRAVTSRAGTPSRMSGVSSQNVQAPTNPALNRGARSNDSGSGGEHRPRGALELEADVAGNRPAADGRARGP